MKSYQDYVIRNGEFIGQFEEMYRQCDDPWHQLVVVNNSYSRLNTILSLQKLGA